MARRVVCGLAGILAATVLAAGPARAEVARVEYRVIRDWSNPLLLPGADLYWGTVHYSIDPEGPAARGITDIKLAPRDAAGRVEYSGDFILLRPEGTSNGGTIVEIPNRGGRAMGAAFFDADNFTLPDPNHSKLTWAGLLGRGFQIALVGWQGDLPSEKMRLAVPTGTGQSLVRTQFWNDATTAKNYFSLGGNCAADTRAPDAQLRILTRFNQTGGWLPRSEWQFASRAGGVLSPDPCSVHVNRAIAPNGVAEVVYTGAPAKVMGLGDAAIRDFVENMKGFGKRTILNGEGHGATVTVLGFGYSQTARFLRDFLYRGFNADGRGGKVFDGMLIAAAGVGRGSFDHRYAMPGAAGNSVMSGLRPVDIFPFSETAESDLGSSDAPSGLLTGLDPSSIPKIMNLFSSSEYWARAGSLLTTSPDGQHNQALGNDSRLYYFPGAVHQPVALGPGTNPRIAPFRPNYSGDMQRSVNALMVDLFEWAHDGKAPPPSAYPTLGNNLVAPNALRFPAFITPIPAKPPSVWQLDFGPRFKTDGIIGNEPPVVGAEYQLLVPQVDANGNEMGGWKGPIATVPLGTYTAWYDQHPELHSFGYLSGLRGGFIPFARTPAEKTAGDTRPSIEELYGRTDPKAEFRRRAIAAIDQAVRDRMLLSDEKDKELKFLMDSWSWIVEGQKP